MKKLTEVIIKDVIQITDEDILNAMAYTLYNKKYKDVLDENEKEWENVTNELLKEIELRSKGKGSKSELSIGGYTFFEQDTLSILCDRFNFFKSSMYITDRFLVIETNEDYFKVGLLNEYDEQEFRRVGKLNEINKFLDELLFPYEWEYKKFFRLGCSY